MKTLIRNVAACAALMLALGAQAAIGSAGTADVTLAGQPADAFAYAAGWNPHAGPNGDTSGFGTTFDAFGTGAWTLLDRFDSSSGLANAGPLTFTFLQTTGTMGTWSVTNTSATSMMALDLVFALHAGNQGGAWLFDNATLMPGETAPGTWSILWTVGQGAHPDFSNLTLFGRHIILTPVPEPGIYGMLLAGLAGLGGTAMVARRQRRPA